MLTMLINGIFSLHDAVDELHQAALCLHTTGSDTKLGSDYIW